MTAVEARIPTVIFEAKDDADQPIVMGQSRSINVLSRTESTAESSS